jgi:hypothetical protein
MTNQSLLEARAKSTALHIVERHAPDCRNRQALLDAIARITLRGLEGHIGLFEAQQRQPSGDAH